MPTRKALPLLCAVALTIASGAIASPAHARQTPAQPRNCAGEAADMKSAQSNARACGRRVEVSGQRGEQTQTFANPDGSYTLEASAQPRRVRRDDGSWAQIDPSLRAVPGGIAPVAVTEKLTFSAGGSGPLVRVGTKAGAWSLSWPTALPAPAVEGDTAVYADVRPGIDLRVRALPTGFTYALAVKERTALRNLQPIRLKVSGPAVRPGDDGGAQVVAADGSVLLSWGAGLMWDSSGLDASPKGPGDLSHSSVVGVRATGSEVVLSPDPAALADPALKLPVYIDPQTSGRNRWAYASSSASDRNDGIARVGKNPDGSGIYRSFFEFPMSTVIGARVISATVNTVLTHSYSCGGTPVDLYWSGAIPQGVNGTRISYDTGLLAQLDEQWGNAHKPSTPPGCSNDPQPDMGMTFGGLLTGKIQEWANAGIGATTLAFSARDKSGNNESTTDRWKKFDVGSTSLVIKYNFVPGTPSPDSMTATSVSQTIGCYTSGTAGQPYLNAISGTHLRAVLTDKDTTDTLVGRFEWQDLTAGTAVVIVPDTPGFPTGHVFDAALPALPQGHSFQWRVHGFDGTDNGPVSSWCHFGVDTAAPAQPTLTSTDLPVYPAAPTANAVIGKPGAVTATPATGDTDIVGYYYSVGNVPMDPTIYIPAAPGGVGTIPVVPVASGLNKNFLTVVAVDVAGNRSPVPAPAANGPGTRQFRADPATVFHTPGDVTGDGKADITVVSDIGGTRSKLLNFDTMTDGETVFNPASPITSDPTVMDLVSSRQFMGDFDGDGRSDLVSIRNEGNCRTTGWVYKSNGNGYVPSSTPWWDTGVGNWCFYNGDKMLVGDFTGDGKDDVGMFYDYGNAQVKFWVLVSTGTTFTGALWWDSGPGNYYWNLMKVVAGDFNRDGKDDIAVMYDFVNCHAGMYRFLSSGSSISSITQTWYVDTAYAWCAENTRAWLPGDFNGDGYGDVTAMYYYGNGDWRIFTWYGPGLANGTQIGGDSGYSDANQLKPVSGDFNGDGRTDLAHFYNYGGTHSKLWILYSTSTGLTGENLRWDSDNGGGLPWSSIRVVQ